MDKIDEQYFETISGIEIRFSVFASANTLEILIENQRYRDERRRNIQHILAILLFCTFFNVVIQPHSILIILNSMFVATAVIKCYVLVNLIRFEKLQVVNGLSLEYTTRYCFGKKHIYLPNECIHDIVINEVIFGLRTIYMLQVLTKGVRFQNQPVVPLLSDLNPRIACIQKAYNLLHKRRQRT